MLYEFKCVKCDTIFEVDCKVSELDDFVENGKCPECGSTEKVRYFSANSVAGVKTIETLDGNKKYQTPSWFKDRIKQINKNVGGNAEVLK